MKSALDEFYKQLKQFKIDNGYLLRMIEDGCDVVLSDELRSKLYMTADMTGTFSGDEDDESILARKQKDPTYGMTTAQKERYLRRKNSKPRPRDIFDVQEIIKAKD